MTETILSIGLLFAAMPVLRATAAAVERQYEVIGNATASVSSLVSSASPEAGTAPKPAVVPNEAYPTLDAEPANPMGTMTLATRRPVPTIAVTLGGPVYPTSIVVTTDAEPSTRPWITSTQEISDVVVVGTGAGSGPVGSGDATDAGGGGQAEGSTQPAGPPQTLGGSSTDPRGQTRVPDGDSPSAPTGTTSFGNAIHVSDGTESVFTTMSFSFSLFTKNGHLTSSVMPVTVVGTTTIPLPPGSPTQDPLNPTSASRTKASGPSIQMEVGVALGGVAALLVLVLACIVHRRRRLRQRAFSRLGEESWGEAPVMRNVGY